jgi:hypothetical protein
MERGRVPWEVTDSGPLPGDGLCFLVLLARLVLRGVLKLPIFVANAPPGRIGHLRLRTGHSTVGDFTLNLIFVALVCL